MTPLSEPIFAKIRKIINLIFLFYPPYSPYFQGFQDNPIAYFGFPEAMSLI